MSEKRKPLTNLSCRRDGTLWFQLGW